MRAPLRSVTIFADARLTRVAFCAITSRYYARVCASDGYGVANCALADCQKMRLTMPPAPIRVRHDARARAYAARCACVPPVAKMRG